MDINKKIKSYITSFAHLFISKDEKLSRKIYNRYHEFTMVSKPSFLANLEIASRIKQLKGDVVECGVWRGGMIAGIAEYIGEGRTYHLFDSFEGLPAAKEIDGLNALKWQNDKSGDFFFNNCTAEIKYAETAMEMSKVTFRCYKGWFIDTLPKNTIAEISLLRLDGDWYDSTMVCLENLYPKVINGGIIIIDDYYTWEGCSRAIHDYLSLSQSKSRIYTHRGIAFIVKNEF